MQSHYYLVVENIFGDITAEQLTTTHNYKRTVVNIEIRVFYQQ